MQLKKNYALLIFLSAVIFLIPFLGAVHLFDWDEINFAESAREMLVTHKYSTVQINFLPFWEKPPLFFWMQAFSMKVFGVNEFAARLPDALTGIAALMTLYFLGKKLYDEKFGFLWALSCLGSFLPHLYFKSGIIDPVFNYFIFLSVVAAAKSMAEHRKKKAYLYSFLAGIACALATLTKGPVAFLILALCCIIYSILFSTSFKPGIKKILVFLFAYIFIGAIWFAAETIKNGPPLVEEFITYQINLFINPVAGHDGPFYYHFVIVFLGCFPLSILALPSLFRPKKSGLWDEINFGQWMRILFWVVMILFSLVRTKIVHYSSLSYYPLSFLAATFAYRILKNPDELKRSTIILLAATGILFSILLAAVPFTAMHKELITPYIKDKFAVACLNTPSFWSGYEALIGIIYMFFFLFSIRLLRRKQIMNGLLLLFYSTALCIFIYLRAVVPGIENCSQAPAINFYRSIAGKNCYVTTIDFKSYAQLFYFDKMPDINLNHSNTEWLLNGQIDKPAYFVAKVTSRDFFESHPDCIPVKEEGGFIFYKRLPPVNK